MAKGNKYGAIKTKRGGITFDSKGESQRYAFLVQMEKAGHISNLERQVVFELHAQGGGIVGKYIADFSYISGGEVVIEDFKGLKTALFRWKAKHLFAEYGKMVKITKKYNDDILPSKQPKRKKR